MTSKKQPLIPIAYSILLVVIAGFLIVKQYPCIAYSNDELTMKSIASGFYTGRPDGHLIYMLYPLGLLLQGLYTLSIQVPWFDGMLLGLHFLCWILLIARVGTLFSKKSTILISQTLVAALIVILDLTHIIHPEYTVLAAWLAGVGLFYLLTAGNPVVSLVLLLFSLWVRKQVFFMALPLVVLALLYRSFCTSDSQKISKENATPALQYAIPLIVLTVVSLIIDAYGYHTPQWKEFRSYNEVRTELYDYYGYPPYDLAADTYQSLGITPASLEVLKAYDLALADTADLQTLRTLATLSKQLTGEWQNLEYWLSLTQTVLEHIVAPVTPVISTVFYLFFLVGIAWLILKERKISVWLLLASILYHAVFIAYFTYRGRLPERVMFDIFLLELCFVGGVAFTSRFSIPLKGSVKYGLLTVLSLMSVLLLSAQLYQGIQTRKENTIQTLEWESLVSYCASHPDSTYYLDTAICQTSRARLFEASSEESFGMLRLGVWTLQSPLYRAYTERLGINNIPNNLTVNGDCFFIQSKNKNSQWLTDYYMDLGYEVIIDVTETILLPTGNELSVLHLVKAEEIP